MNKKSGWQLNDDGPEAYEKYIVPTFSGAWAKDIVKRSELKKSDRILDLACGTGIVARTVSEFLGTSKQITGVDVNEIVLKKAIEIASKKSLSIEYIKTNVHKLPFSDESYDVVLCQQGLQYFPDKLLGLNEVNRILTKKGKVVFSVWSTIDHSPFYKTLYRALDEYIGIDAASILSSAFILDDPENIREMLKKTGFKDIHIRLAIKQMRYKSLDEFLIGSLAASPFAKEILALTELKQNEMFLMIKESISDYIDDDGLAAPMESYVVSAIKH
ncbi:MAG: class I SAM-dependent methyltransferase [Desulfobacterales bacterium]|nr:class I SAM-dependent methyltransferase [Desulfobacterales bacterium]MCP4162214.1 class I SAM-dependent methyltransferase [Deltaproteobacteria bacterium]